MTIMANGRRIVNVMLRFCECAVTDSSATAMALSLGVSGVVRSFKHLIESELEVATSAGGHAHAEAEHQGNAFRYGAVAGRPSRRCPSVDAEESRGVTL